MEIAKPRIRMDNGKKYMDFGEYGVEYGFVRMCFATLYPQFISDFKAEPKFLRNGLSEFCQKYPVFLRVIGAQGLFALCLTYFPYWVRQRRRVIKEHSVEEWEKKLREQKFSCSYCGRADVRMERDHKIPISKGGSDKIDNITPACPSCNKRKAAKLIY